MSKPNDWHVRNVSEEIKRTIRVYAAERNISLAQALEELVKLGAEKVGKK